MNDPDVIRTRNLLIWSQTRYRCATESADVRILITITRFNLNYGYTFSGLLLKSKDDKLFSLKGLDH